MVRIPTARVAAKSEYAERVWLSRDGLNMMTAEASAKAPNETGGVLLGFWYRNDPVVTHVIGPGPKATHLRDAFRPDYGYHESEVARLYEISQRTLHYLGDWHTHPGAAAYLSERDKCAIRRIARTRAARAPRPLMLIFGWGPEWEPKVWQGVLVGLIPGCRRLETHPLMLEIFC